VIYFRCEQCAGAIRADDTQAGQSILCPRCARRNLCPGTTTGRSPLAVSTRAHAEVQQPAPLSHIASTRATTPPSVVRVGVAVLLVTCLGWAAANVWRNESVVPAVADAGGPLSAADRRQREILEQAIDHAPDPALVRVYDEINARHFNGRLPAIPVVWEPRLAEVGPLAAQAFTLEGMFGHIGDRAVILLTPGLARDPAALRRALSHEMVHAWLHTQGDISTGHGPAFQATLKRLSDEGAFAGLVADPEERESLRAWLQAESMRLDTMSDEARREREALALEAHAIELSLTDINARRRSGLAVDEPVIAAWTARRDVYNRRVDQMRARAERARADAAAFNAQVERYHLMVSYPDGLDQQPRFANRQ
jgi:hypothetical protein